MPVTAPAPTTSDRPALGDVEAVPPAIHDLAATRGVPDVDGVPKIEMGRQRGEVVGVMVHVVTIAGLGGAPVPTPVVRHDAVTLL